MELERAYDRFRQQYNRDGAVKNRIASRIAGLRDELHQLEAEQDTLREVSLLFLMAAEYARSNAKATMEKIVTNGLRAVFPGDLSFEIELDDRTDRPEASFYVSSTYGGTQVVKNEPRDARGGGIVDIISLALRVAILESTDPLLEGPLVLDEPAKHVSEEYMPGVGDFIRKIQEAFNRQIILITHNQELAAAGDAAYQFTQREGRTEVSRAS